MHSTITDLYKRKSGSLRWAQTPDEERPNRPVLTMRVVPTNLWLKRAVLCYSLASQATPAAPSVLPDGADEQLFNKPSDQKACSRSSCSSQQESAYYAKLSSSSCPAQGQLLPAHSAKLSISNSPEQQRTASSQEHGSQERLELTCKPSTCGSSFCPSHSCASSFCPGAEISGVTSAGSGGAHLTSPGSVSLEQGVVSQQQATRRVKQRLF